MARIELSNIGGGGGTTLSLTTTGTSGASTLAGSVLNIPVYQGQLTLTTTGTSGAATLVGNTLNIPQYSGGGGTPAGSTGEIQFNNAGAFGASSNLAWDNSNVRLNVGAPSLPTGRFNVRGGGTTSSTVNARFTNSGNTELLKVLDNGNTNIGTGFNWDNTNSWLGVGTTSPIAPIHIQNNGSTSSGAIYIRASNSGASDGAFVALENNAVTATINLRLGGFLFSGLRQSGTSNFSALIAGFASEGWSSSAAGSYITFETVPNGSITRSERMRINQDGNLLIGTTTSSARLHVRGSNTSSGTNALLVQNSTPSDIYKIENDGKISYWATNTAAGTTGAQTINRPSGTVNFAAGASALVVTNSLCTTSSIVFATVRTNDATAQIKNVVPAAGSFTINLSAAATAETSVGFFIIN